MNDVNNNKIKLREKMSKRITGGVLIAAGLTMYIILFAKSLDVVIADPATAKSAANSLLIAGTSLFGLDLAGSLFKK